MSLSGTLVDANSPSNLTSAGWRVTISVRYIPPGCDQSVTRSGVTYFRRYGRAAGW